MDAFPRPCPEEASDDVDTGREDGDVDEQGKADHESAAVAAMAGLAEEPVEDAEARGEPAAAVVDALEVVVVDALGTATCSSMAWNDIVRFLDEH